jgi:hypothetical protein
VRSIWHSFGAVLRRFCYRAGMKIQAKRLSM